MRARHVGVWACLFYSLVVGYISCVLVGAGHEEGVVLGRKEVHLRGWFRACSVGAIHRWRTLSLATSETFDVTGRATAEATAITEQSAAALANIFGG